MSSGVDFVLKLIGSVIYGIVWAAVLLVLAVFILPERIFRKILSKLKPDLISKTAFMSKLRLVFDYSFNNKDVILEDESLGASKTMLEDIATLMREKRVLEGNLFFLDLLKNLSSMLLFSVSHAGYGQSAVCQILDQSMQYLQAYAAQLRASATSQNIETRVFLAAQQLRDQVNDTEKFLQQEESKERVETARVTLKLGTSTFDLFMKQEYESTIENLQRTKQLLAEKFMAFVGETA